jgi:hypothetical protein
MTAENKGTADGGESFENLLVFRNHLGITPEV